MDSLKNDSATDFISLKEVMTERFIKAGWEYEKPTIYASNNFIQYFNSDILVSSAFLNRDRKFDYFEKNVKRNFRILEALFTYETSRELKAQLKAIQEPTDLLQTVIIIPLNYLHHELNIRLGDERYRILQKSYIELICIFRLINEILYAYFDNFIINEGGDLGVFLKKFHYQSKYSICLYEINFLFCKLLFSSFPEIDSFFNWHHGYRKSYVYPVYDRIMRCGEVERLHSNESIINRSFVVNRFNADAHLKMSYTGPVPQPSEEPDFTKEANKKLNKSKADFFSQGRPANFDQYAAFYYK